MEYVSVKCPNCGASMYALKSNDKCKCSNCGNEINIKENIDDGDSLKTNASKSTKSTNKKVINKSNSGFSKKIMYLLIAIVIIVAGIFFVKNMLDNRNVSDISIDVNNVSAETGELNRKLVKGTEYAYMPDEFYVYIARAISNSMIKVEKWSKNLAIFKGMSIEEDIGTYNINECGFYWVADSDDLAFILKFDKKVKGNSKIKNKIFTININSGDDFKGTDYNSRIKCYRYNNDDWHMYRAMMLNDTLLKIECWSRSLSLGDFYYGWDWGLINTKNSDTDFAWTDDEHTSFTITFKDPNNTYYINKPTFVLFELENKGRCASVAEFLK